MLVTTHYMDEAERCHRLAFIFGGSLLDVGTPDEIVARRDLDAAELEVSDATRATALLRARPEVDETAQYGHLLRVITRRRVDALALAREVLGEAGIEVRRARQARPTVEDAFVSMVRRDPRAVIGGAPC